MFQPMPGLMISQPMPMLVSFQEESALRVTSPPKTGLPSSGRTMSTLAQGLRATHVMVATPRRTTVISRNVQDRVTGGSFLLATSFRRVAAVTATSST